MAVYNMAFQNMASRYIVPISKYYVNIRMAKNKNIKEALLSATSIVTHGNNRYDFILDEKEAYTSLVGDISLFYLKYLLQVRDTGKVGTDISAGWSVVTHYYEAFFAASLLLRLFHKGNVFLDSTTKKTLEGVIYQLNGGSVKLDENQLYELTNCSNGNAIITLRKADGNTHEHVWKEVAHIIEEMCPIAYKNSEEKMILESLKSINKKFGMTYPSQLRKKINYQPRVALDIVDRKIHGATNAERWDKYLRYYTVDNNDDDKQINALYAYSQYLKGLCDKLINEYYALSGRENGVLSKFRNFSGDDLPSSPAIIDEFAE